MKHVELLFPFYRWEKQNTARLSRVLVAELEIKFRKSGS